MQPFIQIRRDLHKIPELGFKEFKTQQYILDYLDTLPLERISVSTWETGIFVKIIGTNPKKTIAYRTDIDGLPITEQTDLSFSSEHEGQMHACGHDLHMSIALGILTYFVRNPVHDHLLFIFQPAEEGPGGALPMLETEQMKKYNPSMIFALHVAPEYPVGTIAIKPGLLFANTSELWIELKGRGGHAAFPHLANDMIIAACSLVPQLQTIISRNIDPLDSGVITIGKIEGGTRENIIADYVKLSGTIRTLSTRSMQQIRQRVEQISKGIETSFNCEVTVSYPTSYHQVWNDDLLTNDFIQFIEQMPNIDLVRCREAMTGEDFGYFLEKIPGFMFWLGVDSEYGLHHASLNPNEEAMKVAIETMTKYIKKKANE